MKMMMTGSIACGIVLAAALSVASAQQDGSTAAGTKKAKEWKGDPYPLEICPVSGEKLGGMGDPVVKEYDGREVRFCCDGCIDKFEGDQAKYWPKVDEKIIEDQMHWYPMKECVISGDPLPAADSEEAAEANIVYGNRLIRFCCAGCIDMFEKNPQKHLVKLDKAVVEHQSEHYPLTTCAVSGETLGGMGEPVNMVIGNRLVKLCCGGCKKGLRKEPAKYFAMLKDAWMKQHENSEGGGMEDHSGHDHGG